MNKICHAFQLDWSTFKGTIKSLSSQVCTSAHLCLTNLCYYLLHCCVHAHTHIFLSSVTVPPLLLSHVNFSHSSKAVFLGPLFMLPLTGHWIC